MLNNEGPFIVAEFGLVCSISFCMNAYVSARDIIMSLQV